MDLFTYLGAIYGYNKLRMYDVHFFYLSEQVYKFEPTTHGRTYVVLSLLYVNPESELTLISYTLLRPQLFPRRAFGSLAFLSFFAVYRLQKTHFAEYKGEEKTRPYPVNFRGNFRKWKSNSFVTII